MGEQDEELVDEEFESSGRYALDHIVNLPTLSNLEIERRRAYWMRKYGTRKGCFLTHLPPNDYKHGNYHYCEDRPPMDDCCEECLRLIKRIRGY